MLRISFLLPHLRISGGVRIALTYASALAERGHDVTIYVQSTNSIRRAIANVFHLGYPTWIKGFDAKVMRIPAFTSSVIADADVIIATTCQSTLKMKNLPASKGRQFYLVQHDEGLYHAPREVADEALRSNVTKIVVSTWLQELLREKYSQESLLLINPIDLSQFKKLPRSINDGTVRILLLHHTYEWKGTAEGARIINELKGQYPNVRLILFGVRKQEGIDFPYDEYHYNVPQEKLSELYSNADIYLCPSWDEGFGLPSIEAMACGAALVTYDNGGSRDYAFHEKTALVAKRRDVADLQQQVERLIEDADLRTKISQEGREYVLQMAGWEDRTRELERILSIT